MLEIVVFVHAGYARYNRRNYNTFRACVALTQHLPVPLDGGVQLGMPGFIARWSRAVHSIAESSDHIVTGVP